VVELMIAPVITPALLEFPLANNSACDLETAKTALGACSTGGKN